MRSSEHLLGFGILGCGRMGRRRAQSVHEHLEAKICAVFDTDNTLSQEISEEIGCACANSAEQVILRDDVDCIVISTPNRFHLELTEAAAAAGKHIFCEKPLASTPKEAMAMVRAAKKAGVTLTTGSNLCYFPSLRKAWELVEKKAIGEPMFLRTWIGHQGWNLNGTWFTDPEATGGGTFLDNGCHVLDITRRLFGDVKSCIGQVQTKLWPIEPLEDNGVGIFETLDGKTALVQASWTEWNGYNYLELYGSEGYIRVDNRAKSCLTVLGDRKGTEELFDFSDVPANSYKMEMESYVSHIQKGKQPHPSGYDGMRAVQMAWGVYESAKMGKRVTVNDDYEGIS